MTRALRGINLGGWLVAEHWMTPELFEGVSEHGERAIGRNLGPDEAGRRLKRHRDTFITKADFRWIKAHGFEVVRLPVGYWLFEDSPGYVSGEQYVDKAFEWAEATGLKVILDFHGLQGSQNGQDHSGEVGKIRAYRWRNRRNALRTMQYLCDKYGYEPALIGIEVINEPKIQWFLWWLLRYYDKAIAIAKRSTREDVKIIVSDAYQPVRLARALARRNYGDRLVLDVHLYQLFSDEDKRLSFEEHIVKVDKEWRDLLAELHSYVPYILIGEWSAALPSEMYVAMQQSESTYAPTYFQQQKDLYGSASWAHCYWSYKAPGVGVWSYKDSKMLHK
jgi:glucan 1,3-beta-glucosidase